MTRYRDGGSKADVPQFSEDPFGLLWKDGGKASPPPTRRRRLGREEIVTAALKLADAEGPEALSMRQIAKDIDVGTMSLYYHIPTKDDLLDLMHDQVMGEFVIPADELADDWRDALAQISRQSRTVYENHRWMVSGAHARPQLGPRAFARIEQSLVAMAGIPVPAALRMLAAADDYVIGFVSRQIAVREALRRADMDMQAYQGALRPHVERLIVDRAEEFPNLARSIDDVWAEDEDERFEQGLQWLLAGMAEALPSGG